jgi:hypothetical protein
MMAAADAERQAIEQRRFQPSSMELLLLFCHAEMESVVKSHRSLYGLIFATWRPNEVGMEGCAPHTACHVLGRLAELEMRKCALVPLATAIGFVS